MGPLSAAFGHWASVALMNEAARSLMLPTHIWFTVLAPDRRGTDNYDISRSSAHDINGSEQLLTEPPRSLNAKGPHDNDESRCRGIMSHLRALGF